jgi:2-octaprenyl-3-methyl-6-methoxy-1,4-benzoquinol hydroxylase
MQKFDFVIHGAGMIGSACAVGLAQLGHSVLVVESKPPRAFSDKQPLDMRVSAINLSTERVLERLQAWLWIKSQRCRPYTHLEVFEDERSKLSFTASDVGLPYLGHFLENRLIQLGLWNEFDKHPNLQIRMGASIQTVLANETEVRVTLDDDETVQARWLIGADGMNSVVRQLSSIPVSGKEYDQSALVVSVRAQDPDQSTTWQQFRPEGPLAYLPLSDDHASLVWYETPDKVEQLKKLPDETFLRVLKQTFPERLGEVEVLNRVSFNLVRQHAKHYVQDRTLLIGDAAHSIHPMAGQGVNLGFKDLKVLLDLMEQAQQAGEDPLALKVMKNYHSKRYYDNQLMMSTMDVLYHSFQAEMGVVRTLRQFSMRCAQHAGPIKNQVLKYAVGLA